MVIDREYKGHNYRVMHRINESGIDEFYISTLTQEWSFWSWLLKRAHPKCWAPFTYKAYRGPMSASGKVMFCGNERQEFLYCWTNSAAVTESEFKSLIDRRIKNNENKEKAKAHGDVPVPID